MTYLSTFMVGQELHVAALYDSDGEGRGARDKFVKSWLTRYKEARAEALLLGEVTGVEGDATIEDLFTEETYLVEVVALYRRQLPEEADGKLVLEGGGGLVKRLERALQKHGLPFNKGSVAKALCARIRRMKELSELDQETAARAERLFKAIAKSLGG